MVVCLHIREARLIFFTSQQTDNQYINKPFTKKISIPSEVEVNPARNINISQ